MKRLLGFMVMAVAVLLLPLGVSAAVSIAPVCGDADANDNVTCVVGTNVTDTGVTTLTVFLNEKGGAQVTNVSSVSGSKWVVANPTESNDTWTVTANYNDPDPALGESSLFQFTYHKSGQTDCEVTVCLQGAEGCQSVKPNTTPTDKPTENKQTGSSLPYVALGTIALLAGGAYVVTKNKSKMYRI